ncbi:hypothetical protein L195_g047882 [Trifolium pratense]|uniref:Uncharacterized protein n=1 Tax=Trifolium pratense TaxID=57577 RepID=A0A2K3MLT3_TRIPR|nr:hypothetical protein L195_g047882 [Trifolium pratense]
MANRTAPGQQNARTVSVNSRAGARVHDSSADRRVRGGADRLYEDINAMLMCPSRQNVIVLFLECVFAMFKADLL